MMMMMMMMMMMTTRMNAVVIKNKQQVDKEVITLLKISLTNEQQHETQDLLTRLTATTNSKTPFQQPTETDLPFCWRETRLLKVNFDLQQRIQDDDDNDDDDDDEEETRDGN